MVSAVTWLLDTNVVSEAIRPQPNPAVMGSLKRYQGEMTIAAPVWHELRFGWLRLPEGQRRDAIGRFVQDVAGQLPVLPYDASAARISRRVAVSTLAGQTLPFVDGQIAAIAIAHGVTLVTRNTKDYLTGLQGLRIVDWFQSDSFVLV